MRYPCRDVLAFPQPNHDARRTGFMQFLEGPSERNAGRNVQTSCCDGKFSQRRRREERKLHSLRGSSSSNNSGLSKIALTTLARRVWPLLRVTMGRSIRPFSPIFSVSSSKSLEGRRPSVEVEPDPEPNVDCSRVSRRVTLSSSSRIAP